jgi:hypothetical protein
LPQSKPPLIGCPSTPVRSVLRFPLPAPWPYGLASPDVETPVNLAFLACYPREATPMETDAIRILTRQKLNDGRLPHDSMPRFWVAPATSNSATPAALQSGRTS